MEYFKDKKSLNVLTIFCVEPSQATEATCPNDLIQQAYECCKKEGLDVALVSEKKVMNILPREEDVFVLSEFVGPTFDFLRQCKCTVIGPQCLLVSVHKGELPEVPAPVFSVAMRGLVITTTGCTAQEKKEIQEKIQFMGGIYSSDFLGTVTHLIVKSVADFSRKFKVAIQKDIPVMIPKWVDAVWNASLKESVNGTDPTFARYACLPFQGLVICVSQIPAKERKALKKLIKANGGHYSGQLEMGKTNFLIATSADGEKYTYARRWKIRCLKPEWIHASVNKGYAVSPENFIVEKSNHPPRCSTPEKVNIQQVDETVGFTTTIFHHQQCDSQSTEAPESLDLALSKKADPLLGGRKVKKAVAEQSVNAQEDTQMVQQYLTTNHSEEDTELINRANEADYPPGGEPIKTKQQEPEAPFVLKSNRPPVATPTSDAARQLPNHFDMSTPQTPMVESFAAPTIMTRSRPGFSDTPTSQTLVMTSVGRPVFNMPTPDTPYGRLLNANPSPDTRKMWKHAIDNRVVLTPDIVQINPDPAEQSRNVIDPEFFGLELREKLRLDDGEQRPIICKVDPPFSGVVAFIHQKIEVQRSELVSAVKTLGGRVHFQHSEKVTHFVYQGKLPTSNEVRLAKFFKNKFVSPQWILDCKVASVRLEESRYPPSLNPKLEVGDRTRKRLNWTFEN